MSKMKSNIIKVNTILFLILLFAFSCAKQTIQSVSWDSEKEILKRIVVPKFNDQIYNIINYGAIGDGKTDCSKSFKSAIEECNKSGGGKVIVPKGIFITGAIHLKSNVNLYLNKGAIIKFSANPDDYLPVVYTRWEGVECMNYSPLIYAFEQENIAVTGQGIIDGSGDVTNWWSWSGKEKYGWKKEMPSQKEARLKLFTLAKNKTPLEQRIFGKGYYLRPALFQPYKCKNILIDSVTFKNSPMWFLNPVLCTNVTINNVTVEGLGPNNDGCDPECSKDILIKNCYFNNGDDCIAIKSGRNADGRRVNIPSENIIIKNCTMKEGHGGVVIGSEISGGVRNVFVSDCVMDSPNLDKAIRLKTNSIRGGVIENLFVKDLTIGQVKEAAIHVDCFYEEGDAGNFTPEIKNLFFKNLKCNKSAYALWIKAYDRSPVKNINLENCSFNEVEKPNILLGISSIKLENVKINNLPFTLK
jgi:polygalacturonase